MREQLTETARRFVHALEARGNGTDGAGDSGANQPSEERIRTLLGRGTLRREGAAIVHDEEVAQVMGLSEFDYS